MIVKRYRILMPTEVIEAVPLADYDALVSVCRELIKDGTSLGFYDSYHAQGHTQDCSCGKCIRLRNWRLTRTKALALLDGEKKEGVR